MLREVMSVLAQFDGDIDRVEELVTLLEQRAENIGQCSVQDQVREYAAVREANDRIKGLSSRLYKVSEFYKNTRIPKTLHDEDIKNITTEEGFRVALQPQLRVKTLDMEEGMEWVRENAEKFHAQPEDIITTTLNASKMKGLAKELANQGFELPDELFEVTYWDAASLTKKAVKS